MFVKLLDFLKNRISLSREILESTESNIELMLWDIENRLSIHRYNLKSSFDLDGLEDLDSSVIQKSQERSQLSISILEIYFDVLTDILQVYRDSIKKYHIGYSGYKILCLFLFSSRLLSNLNKQLDCLHEKAYLEQTQEYDFVDRVFQRYKTSINS